MAAPFLNIDGVQIQNAILLNVEVTQQINQHWSCRVECRDALDARPNVENWLGKDLQVVTYDEDGAETAVFDGFIQECQLEYEIYGSYRATISGISKSWKLDLTPQERYFRQATLQDVAGVLTGDDGLTCTVADPGGSLNYVQWSETDFQFIRRLADDAKSWIRPTKNGIEVLNTFQAGATVDWSVEGGLISFEIAGRLRSPAFNGTHYDASKMESQTFRKVSKSADFYSSSGPMLDAVQRASGQNVPAGYISLDARAPTSDDYQKRLEHESVRSIGSAFRAYGVSRQEKLRAGDTVEVTGAGIDFHGTYGLIKVQHKWTQQGYENHFECTNWKNWMAENPPEPRRMRGVVPARVVDNNDPLEMGRLKIQYDWLETGETAWARMVTPHGGADRGFMFMPEIGDEVLVGFEHGDAERPYVLGSLWNGVDKAPREDFWGGDMAANDIKRIVTKSGHRIQISDKSGKEAIVISTPRNLKISMFEKADETGRPMISIHNESGDVFFSAPNGRIHFESKYFSREVGTSGSAPSGASNAAASASGATAARKLGTPPQPLAKAAAPQAAAAVAGAAAATGSSVSATPKVKTKTWVEIQLLDSEGKPVRDEPYKLSLPDGSTRTGRTDADGRARYDGIDSGACTVTFPERDADDWSRS